MEETLSRADRAAALFESGYSCGQAVVCAFADKMGLPEEDALLLSAALGGGLCRMRETCGAFTGALIVLGKVCGSADAADTQAKAALYAQGQLIGIQFQQRFGTLCCRELINLPKDAPLSPEPTPRTPEFYDKRPCTRFVREAARLLAEQVGE